MDSPTITMADIHQTWSQAKDYLKDKLGNVALETWILPLEPKSQGQQGFILEAPDDFFKEWVDKHYKLLIQEALSYAGKKDIAVHLESSSAHSASSVKLPAEDLKIRFKESRGCPSLNPRYTFENFVIGPSNRHAHAYSVAVADSPGKVYNPLFIYGGVGLGKTHIMQAICHYTQHKDTTGQLKICYMTSERFTNELIEGIQRHSTASFRQKYRGMDVLVIDDIQFLAGKESTQEEFFNTFNTLYDAHKQIILSSDRPPKEISNLQDRLVSRFGWGLTTDIQPPDLETRMAILKKKIEREPVTVPDDVILFIAQLIKTNIRELEGALIRTMAYSLLEEKPITLELTKEVLKDLLRETKKLITVDFIQRCVVEEFGVSLHDLKTKRRHKTIVLPRQVAMYLSRELTELSLPEIGAFFGGKDHTTVLHSYNKIKDKFNKNEQFHHQIERLIRIITQ